MFARRLLAAATLTLLFAGTMALPASAQFTPRFSSRRTGPPVQWHVGLGATFANLGDYTSEVWPLLNDPVPVFHARLGVAVPLKGESLLILPEIEFHTSSTEGEYVHPLLPGRVYPISSVGQRGFSVMASLVRSLRERNVLMGIGLGYHLIEHDPVTNPQMVTDGVPFHEDPFNHIGIGFQAHYARRIAQLAEDRILMLEGRYKAAFMSGNVSGRTFLLSEFQLTFYIAIK
jgi:hypothetical protein